MKKANEFDAVFDSQQVFRKLLEAFSNPGRPVDISGNAQRMDSQFGAYLAVAETLIDNETSFSVIGNDELPELVRQNTYGRLEQPDQSSFIFVLADCNPNEIKKILDTMPIGTLEDPHKSGVVFVRVEFFETKPGCALRGPGIDGRILAPLPKRAEQWIQLRGECMHEYPCGVDIAFITDGGQIVAAPRLVQLAG